MLNNSWHAIFLNQSIESTMSLQYQQLLFDSEEQVK